MCGEWHFCRGETVLGGAPRGDCAVAPGGGGERPLVACMDYERAGELRLGEVAILFNVL